MLLLWAQVTQRVLQAEILCELGVINIIWRTKRECGSVAITLCYSNNKIDFGPQKLNTYSDQQRWNC